MVFDFLHSQNCNVVILKQSIMPAAFLLYASFKFIASMMYFPMDLPLRISSSTNLLPSRLSSSLLICVLVKECSCKS